MPHGNVRALFAHRGFRRLLVIRLIGQLGDGLFQAGLASSVLFNPEKAATPAAIAFAFGVLLVPYSALGPFFGVLLDRWSRRTTLFLANTVRAILVVPAALYVWIGRESALFIVIALAIIALNRFFLAGLSAALPHVVENDRLVTANSLSTTLGTAIYTAGLGIAGGTFHLIGTGFHPYAIVSVTAALAYGLCALLIQVGFGAAALGPDEPESRRTRVLAAMGTTARGMVDGIRHLAGHRAAASLLLVQAAHRGLYGVSALMLLLLFRNYYRVDNAEASMDALLPIAGAAAVGSLLCALITPAVTRRIGGWQWVTSMIGILALAIPGLGLPYIAILAAAAAFLVSMVTQGTKIVTDTALQVDIADEYRGRVFSVNDTAFNLMFVVGLAIGATILPADGHAPAVTIAVGVGYAITAAAYGVYAARLHQPHVRQPAGVRRSG
jgi:MFS family permease